MNGRTQIHTRDRRGEHMQMETTRRRRATGSTGLVALLLAAPALAGTAGTVAAQEWEPQIPEGSGTYPTGSLFIQDVDTVWTAAGDVLAGADILIRDGVIRAIGADLDAPSGVRVVDGSGLHAMPGIVDEHSHIAMEATNEYTAPLVPEVRVMDALDPDDFGIYQALSGGVTTARIMHGSSNPVGGQSAVIKARWGMEDAHDLLVPGAPRFVKFALGENVTRKGGGFDDDARFPHSRQGVEAIYRQAFTAAQGYRDTWQRYREEPEAFAVPPRTDLRMEALVDIMEGRVRIHAHSYRADEILMLMRIAEAFDFRIDVFTHVLEGYKVASEMAEHGAAGSTFSDWWHYKLEAYDAIPFNAALMHEAGVLTAINSDIPWLQSFMFHEVAKPVRYGNVSKEDALRMLTLNPARMMYIDDRVGSLEVGKHGDVVLLSRSPFDAFARVEKTVVDGIVYYDLSAEEETRGEPIVMDAVAGPLAPPQASAAPGAGEASSPAGSAAAATAAGVAAPAGGPAADGSARSGAVGPVQEAVVALVGGTVHPVSGPPIPNGTVVVRGDLIEAVGPAGSVEVPAEARRIDVTGRHVYPGLIDALSPLGIVEFGSIGQATDQYEVGEYNPHIRAIAAVMPEFPQVNVSRMNGMTAAGVAQSTGVIQGQLGVIAFNDGDTFERVTIEDRAALVIDLPVDRTGDEDEEPALEGDGIEELMEVFDRARLYAAEPTVSDDPTRRFEANEWGGDRVFLEAMLPSIRGEQPVFFRIDTEWQLRHLFLLLDAYPELDAVVVGGGNAYREAEELARREIPVVLTLSTAYRPTGERDRSVAAAWRNAAALHAAGVTIGFASDDAEHARNVPYMAAHAVAFGLPEDAAVRALTLDNARILGLGDRTGSLEPGKRADLIVTDGSPLQYLTTIDRMWVGGREVDPQDNAHWRAYQEYRGRN